MDEEEFQRKYVNLRILKSIQEYLKEDNTSSIAVYPIRVPEDFLYQTLRLQGADKADKLIHYIFKLGLTSWNDKLFDDVFGSERSLEEFIQLVKKRSSKKE
jgi:hypothetical protein